MAPQRNNLTQEFVEYAFGLRLYFQSTVRLPNLIQYRYKRPM
jgi:hypothetical protein